MKKKILICGFLIAIIAVCLGLIACNNDEYTDAEFTYSNGTYILSRYTGDSTSFVVPKKYKNHKVTEIGSGAFENNSSLESVTISRNITRIGGGAFSGCINLESITLPFVGERENIELMSSKLFGWIFGSKSFSGGVKTEQPILTSDTYQGTPSFSTSYIPEKLHQVTILGGAIPRGAFSNCTTIKNIRIMEGVKIINRSAFSNCSNLENCYLSDGLECIESGAFAVCNSLIKIDIPNSVTRIGNAAFSYCCNLSSVSLGRGIAKIDMEAFRECKSLNNLNYKGEINSWCQIDFCDKFANPLFYAGELKINDKLINNLDNATPETIKPYSFTGWQRNNLTIPQSVKKIDIYSFYNCTNLKVVHLSNNVTTIEAYAFMNCVNLEKIDLPNSLISIGYYAFKNCSSLTNIVVPKSVESISLSAFNGCSGLISITLPFIGTSKKLASDDRKYPFGSIFGTFNYEGGISTNQYNYLYDGITEMQTYNIPKNLKEVIITGGDVLYGAFQNCKSIETISIIGEATTVESYAFYNCANLNTVFLDVNITSIESWAFSYSSNIKNIYIPNSLIKIGSYAFRSCSNLKYIILPETLNSIGENAFYNCSSLTIFTHLQNSQYGWNSNWNSSNCSIFWGDTWEITNNGPTPII